MDYKEFRSKLGTNYNIGDKVWVCDYRFNNIDEKPIRHIEPIEVFIISNDNLPKGKRVYYSDVHFRPIGKGDKPVSKVIAPYDTTGYRMYAGVSLNIFINEQDCKEHYRNQCMKILSEIEEEKKAFIERMDTKYKEVEGEMMNNV